MTSAELHHYFGNATNPVFHLVRPRFVPLNASDDAPRRVKLTVSSAGFHLDAVLASSDGLLAAHLISEGLTVDGETVNLQQLLCHYRATNATHVVSANNCDGDGVDGIIVTPDTIGSLHPLPPRLLPPLWPLLPCSYSSPAPEGTYGLHILHLRPKSIPGEGRNRTRREATAGHGEDEDAEEEHLSVCGVTSEHDVRGVAFRRPPRFRDLRELTGDLDLQATGASRGPVGGGPSPPLMQDGHLEDHNHTITAEPVSAVLRRTVELAVFCDKSMYQDLPLKLNSRKKSQLINYALTIINAVQGIYHQDELQGYVVDLSVVKLDVLTSNTRDSPNPSGGDIGAYLNDFCAWQMRNNPSGDSNPQHWDHALMLSGLDLHSSGNPSVIGLAWVGGMCSPKTSCTMNEGRDFSSVYVVAHEMGHNFGMNHDGQGSAAGCSSSNYIMSPSVGPGKTTWSTCSTQVIHNFLRGSSCLEDGAAALGAVEAQDTGREGRTMKDKQQDASLKRHYKPQEIQLDSVLRKTPGFSFPLQEQCKAIFGRDYHPALTKDDLCKYLYCTNGVVTRPAHPALEGSFCGSHRVCIAGKCKPEEELVNLIGYNTPATDAPPSEPLTTSPSSMEDTTLQSTTPSTNTLPTTTITSLVPCIENSSAADTAVPWKPCINDSSAEVPDSCDCIPKITPPADIASIPKEICPFLAPVYHEVFECSSECPLFDLHLDLTSGNLTQILIGSNLLSDLSQSCMFDHYSVIRGPGRDTMVGSIPRMSHLDSKVCKGLPHFLHQSLGCPYVGSENQEQDCIPRNIVVKTASKSLTYTQSQGNTEVHRSILWKGTHYSLRTESDAGHQDSTNSHIFTIHTGVESLTINCNLEATFPDVLQNVPRDVCPFIAPVLHGLFNCLEEDHCTDYAVIIDLQEHNITKVPLLNDLQRHDSCVACAHERKDIEAVLSEIIQAVIPILSQSTFFCKLLPGSLSLFIPSCLSAPVLEAISEDTCPPTAVVVETDSAAFTYSLDTKRSSTDLPQLKWHGRLFSLYAISTDKDPLSTLREKYSLNARNSVTRKYDHREMEIVSRQRNNLNSVKSSSPAGGSHHHHHTTAVHLADGPLVEYIGQSDKFLPLNAPMAMPRTKVGECSVTCGQGVRTVEQECVDVLTEELMDNDACQGYAVPKPEMESCVLPDCLPPQMCHQRKLWLL
ncbi:uncharacterized protein LOC126998777 isoform X2 [Eriocheir sinensis]|uniref:uncharacterized protein LOC126998777 isoform X2 n=1 Tax=Eriocheir sinensis TaxID=95602 RepID=UPI0021C71050|nr:uncharacterized protein LOC126998777 isoform X2 [Eriocheir sinensis]